MQPSTGNELSEKCFQTFNSYIHELTGITIRDNRRDMLAGRLRKRMRELKIDTYEGYLEHLKNHEDSHASFVNAITTNETYFYRTPRIWDYIHDVFLPEWHTAHVGATLRVWSAASSTGEEAHTLGIVMEHFKDNNCKFDYKIQGTDIAPRVIEHANKGIYIGRSVERFRAAQPEMFSRYMTGDDEKGFCVNPEIKSRISFKEYNLFDKAKSGENYDLVLLRNVLIYFTKEDQKRVMAGIHKQLSPEGITIIGESETLNGLGTSFETVSQTIYKAVGTTTNRKAA